MDIQKSEYVAPPKPKSEATAPKPKPEIVAAIQPYVAEGIDTLFDVTTETDNWERDKRFIQTAANSLGVAARIPKDGLVHFTDEAGNAMTTITFRVRPMRVLKSKDETVEPDSDVADY